MLNFNTNHFNNYIGNKSPTSALPRDLDIKALIFDIDGVITDGRAYWNSIGEEVKCFSYKDLDAIRQIRESGCKVGCISGEDGAFSRMIAERSNIDVALFGRKDKANALREIAGMLSFDIRNIAYIGDGLYDVDALQIAGLSLCPRDAVTEAITASHVTLNTSGGHGCIAEIFTRFIRGNERKDCEQITSSAVIDRFIAHRDIIALTINNAEIVASIARAAKAIATAFRTGHRLFICGNGGSAADAQHIAGEFVGRFYLERSPLPAISLTTDTSVLTCLSNDYDFSIIFARQVEALCTAGDILLGISTSGGSINILKAFQAARARSVDTILMTGSAAIDNRCAPIEEADNIIYVPSSDTPRIQEVHILIAHTICELVEQELSASAAKQRSGHNGT